ncbi:MAG: ABC-2 family transporter protein [Phycisphaerales bacterium]|nr:ABC-2 family transporter protein [Phycisphaerales bacterium]
MSRVVRVFLAYLRAKIGVMLQYRGEILLWSIWGIINPAVLYAMWSAAASGNENQSIAGLDRGGFAAYYFVMMIVGHLTGAWDVYHLGYLIRSGQLSPMLLRPVLPIWETLADNLSYKITTLMFVVPMWALFAWLVTPRFETSLWQVGMGFIAVLLGAGLNYMLCHTAALLAFWATKLDAMGEIYFGLCMFLGGRFAPMNALPGPILAIAEYLPFRWMFAFPTELLIGKIASMNEALIGVVIQSVWLVGVVILYRLMWSVAVKRYTAVSG